MSLGSDQREFALLAGKFIVWIYKQGYELSLGDFFRDPRLHGKFGEKVAYGSSKSYHKKKLAMDLNLFKDGKYLGSTASHAALGKKWKSMHPKCVWGGDFGKSDGNHYSFGEGR